MNKKIIIILIMFLFAFFSSLGEAQDREVKVINLNYQEASSLESVLNSVKSPDGEIAVFTDSNTIILNDYPDRLRQMEKVIGQLDVRKKQVAIKTTIVEVSDELVRSGGLSFSSSIISREEFDNFIYLINHNDSSSIRTESSITTVSGRPAVLRIVDEIIAGGYFTHGHHYDLYHEPYEIEAGIILEVLPKVSANDNINLSIRPEMSEFKRGMTKHERSISTQVNLNNGETMVLGGANLSKDRLSQVGIPLIDITVPAQYQKTEKSLVFFLTVEVLE